MELERAFEYMTPEDRRRVKACLAACAGIPTEKLEAAGTDNTHGCHCDLEDGQKPDACVMDRGDHEDCIYATKLFREGKTKLDCEYWQPISLGFRLTP